MDHATARYIYCIYTWHSYYSSAFIWCPAGGHSLNTMPYKTRRSIICDNTVIGVVIKNLNLHIVLASVAKIMARLGNEPTTEACTRL